MERAWKQWRFTIFHLPFAMQAVLFSGLLTGQWQNSPFAVVKESDVVDRQRRIERERHCLK
jgi:hypothetical protein